METIRHPVECPYGLERRSVEDRRGSETRPLAPYGAKVVVDFAVRDPVGEQSAEVRLLCETVAFAARPTASDRDGSRPVTARQSVNGPWGIPVEMVPCLTGGSGALTCSRRRSGV